MVGDIWENWSSDMAQTFVQGAYPLAISQQTIAMTDEFIATHRPPAALRRLLMESRDGVQRALRAQECDRRAGQTR